MEVSQPTLQSTECCDNAGRPGAAPACANTAHCRCWRSAEIEEYKSRRQLWILSIMGRQLRRTQRGPGSRPTGLSGCVRTEQMMDCTLCATRPRTCSSMLLEIVLQPCATNVRCTDHITSALVVCAPVRCCAMNTSEITVDVTCGISGGPSRTFVSTSKFTCRADRICVSALSLVGCSGCRHSC